MQSSCKKGVQFVGRLKRRSQAHVEVLEVELHSGVLVGNHYEAAVVVVGVAVLGEVWRAERAGLSDKWLLAGGGGVAVERLRGCCVTNHVAELIAAVHAVVAVIADEVEQDAGAVLAFKLSGEVAQSPVGGCRALRGQRHGRGLIPCIYIGRRRDALSSTIVF